MDTSFPLSQCLQDTFQAVGGSEEISSLALAKTICKQHDDSGSPPYSEIQKIDGKSATYHQATPDQWLEQLTGACSSEADILHTNLALLLLARNDPRLSSDFAPAIDAQLRGDLYRLLADYTQTHEIRGNAEFVELLDNVRKWQPKHSQMQGRRRTAVLYSADTDLSRWASALQQLQGHPYLGLRFRVPASGAADTLADGLRNALLRSDPSQSIEPPLVERVISDTKEGTQIERKLGAQLPTQSGLPPLIAALRKGLDSAGPRLVLFVELEADQGPETITAAQQLGSLFEDTEEDEGRLTLVIGGVPQGTQLSHSADAAVYRLETTPELEDTGQTWKNDLAKGEDLLNIRQEAEALADGIASKELQPPLVVGICGGWGGGKSFILHLIEQHLKQIQQAKPSKDSLYVGHIYWIDFDAWYYSKQNIWASLMDRILSELERQMNVERIMARGNSQFPQDKVPWEITRELTDREIVELADDQAWKARLYETQNGEMRLLLDPAEERLKAEIGELEEDLQEIEEQREVLQDQAKEEQKAIAAKRRELDEREAGYRNEIDQIRENYIRQSTLPRLVEHAKNQFSDYLLERIGIDPKHFKQLRQSDEVRGLLNQKDVSRLLRIAKSSPTVWGFVLALLLSLCAMAWGLVQMQSAATTDATATGAALSGLLAAIYSAWSTLRSTFDQMLDGTRQALQAFGERYAAEKERIDLVREELSIAFDQKIGSLEETTETDTEDQKGLLAEARKALAEIEKIHNERPKDAVKPKTTDGRTQADLVADAEAKRNQIKQKREQLGKSISDNPGLVDFLQSIRVMGSYREHLGLLDTVQHHLKELSRILLYTANHREMANARPTAEEAHRDSPFLPFERGSPRIYLVIDDLDRCPPRQVVTVLEAAQLLMKTELFVVLMAIDLRYITRALEKVYRGILDHERHPTGLDYIEKIIQLPYRVRDVSSRQLSGFFTKNLDVAEEPAAAVKKDDTGIGAAQVDAQQQTGRVVEIPAPEVKQETLKLSQDEFKNLVDACNYLSLSPRSAKRITNVYKIWKLIWHRRMSTQQNPVEIRVMIALLALSTLRPRLVRHGLLQMNTMARLESMPDQQLQVFFNNLAVQLLEPQHVHVLLTEGRLLPESFTLSQLSQPNLNLLTSFSFVGDDESSENKELI